MSRIFRLFISSTFSDFMLERERLQKYVFPELEKYCASKGAKFLAVDLRWGITEAAQVEHDTLRICLDEIRRSQKLSPRPNFAVLLGNRYGWEPIPARIPLDHWTRLLEYANAKNQKIIRSAYYPRPDTNAIPPNYVLKSREGDWSDSEVSELSVRDALRRCAASFDKAERLPYFASATHQEIVMGAMETPNAKEHVHVYVRSIKYLPFIEEANAFIDWDAKTGGLVEGASERLKGLELELRARLPGMVRDYGTSWIGSTSPNLISDSYLDAFCKQFFEDQKALIDQEMERLGKVEQYELREMLHEDFARARSENFVGREATLKVIYSYIASIASQSNKKFTPLILHGEGGSGKSAIMAHAYQTSKTRNPNAVALVRFIGGVPGCEEIGSILRDLIEDICRYYQSPVPQEMNSVKELNQAFESVMQLSSEDRPLILFLDALDQLDNGDGAWLLEWLPKSLSPNTRFILTTREGVTLNSAKRKIPKSLKPVTPMSNSDGAKMLNAWLHSHKEARFNAGISPAMGRRLSVPQRSSVLDQFKRCQKPLWLKLVYEEVRSWHSWDEPRIFPNEIKGMVSELINKRLLKDDKHLPIFTHRALAYIAAGRFGLAEDELAKALGSDEAVRAEFKAAERTDKKWPIDRNQLPPILWSRLYFDLSPYLSSAQIDGAELFRYFHREFKEVVEEQLLKDKLGQEIHAQLAIMFSKMGDQNTNVLFRQTDASAKQQSPALRRIMEEPWQLAKANKQKMLVELLSNFSFCVAKCAANKSKDLIDDFETINKIESLERWRSLLSSWQGILERGNNEWPSHKILVQLCLETNLEKIIDINNFYKHINWSSYVSMEKTSYVKPLGVSIFTKKKLSFEIKKHLSEMYLLDDRNLILNCRDKGLFRFDLLTSNLVDSIELDNVSLFRFSKNSYFYTNNYDSEYKDIADFSRYLNVRLDMHGEVETVPHSKFDITFDGVIKLGNSEIVVGSGRLDYLGKILNKDIFLCDENIYLLDLNELSVKLSSGCYFINGKVIPSFQLNGEYVSWNFWRFDAVIFFDENHFLSFGPAGLDGSYRSDVRIEIFSIEDRGVRLSSHIWPVESIDLPLAILGKLENGLIVFCDEKFGRSYIFNPLEHFNTPVNAVSSGRNVIDIWPTRIEWILERGDRIVKEYDAINENRMHKRSVEDDLFDIEQLPAWPFNSSDPEFAKSDGYSNWNFSSIRLYEELQNYPDIVVSTESCEINIPVKDYCEYISEGHVTVWGEMRLLEQDPAQFNDLYIAIPHQENSLTRWYSESEIIAAIKLKDSRIVLIRKSGPIILQDRKLVTS